MAAKRGYNVVTFRPYPPGFDGQSWSEEGSGGDVPLGGGAADVSVALTMEGAITLTCGLKPNVWGARCSHVEFKKLGDDVGRTGTLGLWFSSDPKKAGAQPDVKIEGVTILDVDAHEVHEIPGTRSPLISEYRISLTDFRDRYVEPRGGRLRLGLVNPGDKPAPDDAGDDEPDDFGDAGGGSPTDPGAAVGTSGDSNDGEDTPEVGREMTLSEMILACLKTMRVEDLTLPPDVDDNEAPRDVKWLGNHAPAELDKLLQLCQCVFVPLTSGQGVVRKIGDGAEPAYPADDALPELRIPAIDRRGKAVIFSSCPTHATGTETLLGPSPDTWYVVMQERSGKWTRAGDTLLPKTRNNFADIPAQYRQRAAAQAYRFIQLDPKKYPAAVMTRRFGADGKSSPISVTARVAVPDPATGLWANSDAPIEIPARFISEGNILQLGSALLRVERAVPRDLVFTMAQELSENDLTVKFSYEISDPDEAAEVKAETSGGIGKPKKNKATTKPRFFHAGYRKAAGSIVEMTADEIDNALDGHGRDTFVVTRPEMRLIVTGGEPKNEAELKAACRALADKYLADSGKPTRLLSARGFAAVECSGLVSEVRWDAAALQTTATISNWWMPTGALGDTSLLRRLESQPEAYPNQGKKEAERKSLGETGAAQRVTPIQPESAPAATAAGGLLTQIAGLFHDHGGFYTGRDLSGPATSAAADSSDKNKNNLTMPEGQSVADGDLPSIVYNVVEHGRDCHMLVAGRYYPALPVGYDPVRKARILAIAAASAEHAFRVDLTKDGGYDGTSAAAPSYTYTAKVKGTGEVLGKLLSPERTLRYQCPTTDAGAGLLYFDGALPRLLDAFETPTGVSLAVVTQVRFDTTTGKIQVKTRTVLVLQATDESDWADVAADYYNCP